MIVPPATLGILGGGQLGRYFVLAARTMGDRTMVLEPDPGAPAGAIAAKSRGMRPQSPYAMIACTTPTDASLRTGRAGLGSLTEPS